MPDNENLLNTQELEDSVSIDNLTQSPDLDGDDVVVLVHENNGVKSTYKAILRSIANFINKLLHYSSDLHTQNDTIIGAINELADGGGGGSADIISEASGSIVTITDGGDNIPVKSLVTEIVAVQAGTGTPSPSNVRPITGFDTVVITNKDDLDNPTTTDTHTITLPETIYGGSLEATSGQGKKQVGYIVFDGSNDEDWSYSTGNKWATITISDMKSGANQDGITNWLPKSTSYGYFGFALGRNNNNFYVYQIPDISGVSDLATWKTYLSNNPLQVVYPLATETDITTTPEEITTLGNGQTNNIYSNSGDVEVEYFNENADQMAELIRVMTR